MRFSTALLQMGNNTGIEVPAEIVTAVLGAKAAETRARRIVAVITKLGG